MTTRVSQNVPPGNAGSKPADPRDGDAPVGDWSRVRDLLQSRLAPLDGPVLSQLRSARVQPGSNRAGAVHLFVYRTYEPGPGSEIDPIVVGVAVEPAAGIALDEGFRIRADIAGESLGDVPFELPTREVVGWDAMIGAARDAAERLAGQTDHVLAALRDESRRV